MDSLQGVINMFTRLTEIGMNIGLAAAAFYILLSGFQYMSASGNPMAMEHAKSSLKNAAIGFAIVLLARALASLIQTSIRGG